MTEYIVRKKKRTIFDNSKEKIIRFVFEVGDKSYYHIMPDKDYGILGGCDTSDIVRKYFKANCIICDHEWEVRYDHIVNRSKRISREGKDGTVCPYCAPALYKKMNVNNVGGKNREMLYFYRWKDRASGKYHNKVGETKLPKKKLTVEISSEKIDKDIATALIKKRVGKKLWKLPTFEIIAWHYSEQSVFIERHILNDLQQQFPTLFENKSSAIADYFDGHTEVFLETSEFTKVEFEKKCKQYDLLSKSVDNLEELWLDRFNEIYGKEMIDTLDGQKSVSSLFLKPRSQSVSKDDGITEGLKPFMSSKPQKQRTIFDFS